MRATPSIGGQHVMPRLLKVAGLAVALFALATAGITVVHESREVGNRAAVSSPTEQHEVAAGHERMRHAVAHPTSSVDANMHHSTGSPIGEQDMSAEDGMVAPHADGVEQLRAGVIIY